MITVHSVAPDDTDANGPSELAAARDSGGTGTPSAVEVSPAWLALREPADAAARSLDLVEALRALLPVTARTVVHDLGGGTGSMGRWLAPRLPGPQHWVVYDRDPDLLARAAATGPSASADGSVVTVETRQRDITRLDRGELAGASLVTASALLDMLTFAELARMVAATLAADCPVLVTLSVVGRVALTPHDPLDETVAVAFNDHQRRTTDGRRLLGPDAVAAAVELWRDQGAEVHVEPSPWRLQAGEAALAAEWFRGWVAAACEQQVELTEVVGPYARRRLAEAAAGRLGVVVQHQDLLVSGRRGAVRP